MSGTGSSTRGVWVWVFLGFNIVASLVLWWFGWLPAVGQIPHSGVSKPTTIKIYLLVMAILSTIFLIYTIWRSAIFSTAKMRSNSAVWPFFIATIILWILTIWGYLLDDKIRVVFTDGIPVLPIAYDASAIALYYEWVAFLVFMVTFITIIIVASIGGILTMWDVRSVNGSVRRKLKKQGFATLSGV